tara:strand:+ start:19807 stop:21363 length:1557 start_codon:yes stop_codon:yes gene_type:complete
MYLVKENKDQTIDIYQNNKLIKKFYPSFNLHKSSKLLSEFNNLKDVNDNSLYTRWSHKGIYLIPAIQELLFWDYFVGLVAYKDLHDFLKDKKFKISVPSFYVNGRLQRMQNLLYGRTNIIKRIIYNLIAWFLRKRFRQKHRIFLNDDGFDGFRFRDFKNSLGEIELFHRVENISFKNILRLFFDRSTFPMGKFSLKSSNINNIYKISDELSKYFSKSSFEDLINAIDSKCLDIISESLDLDKVLDFNKIELFLTYDQTETCNAMVLSSRLNSLKTIAFQHGPFSNFHSGWIGYGIDSQFCNLKADQIMVWGKYWKDFLSKISNKYSDSDIFIGAHINKTIDYDNYHTTKETNKPLKLLVPYEFLANNIEISLYLEKFLDMNIKITIKLRPQGDGDIQSDLYSYSKSIQANADFVYDIEDSELRTYDAVICTQSIFSVEMMRFNTPIWYLDTSVPFLKNIADHGYAHFLTLKDIKAMKSQEDICKYLKPKYNKDDYKEIFSDKNLKEQLIEIIEGNNNE